MRIGIIAAGAAGMYCGSCLRDNALSVALQELGHDVTFIPTYTPLRLDEESVEHEPVFLNGIQVYLEDAMAPARRRGGWLRRVVGSSLFLKWISKLAVDNEPSKLGKLTVSMLQGAGGNLRASVDELIEWMENHYELDVVHLSNVLLSGLAPSIKKRLRLPVTCGLTGEDQFLQGLPEPHASDALQLLRENSDFIDRFIAPSRTYGEYMADWIGLDEDRVATVLPGISTRDYEPLQRQRRDGPLTVGFFARIAPEKGVHLLSWAFGVLAREFPELQLRIAGYLSGRSVGYAAAIRRELAAAGLADRVQLLGTLDRQQKIAFLKELDVFAMPSMHPESKALPVIEALAAGVPVVVPDSGSLPELIDSTGGGLLHESRSVEHLTEALRELLYDHDRRHEMGQRGREAVFDRFTARRMAEETAKVYRAVVESFGKASP